MVHFSAIRQPATNEQLSALEARIGHPLPMAYRLFLQTTNGGQPEPSAFRIHGNQEDQSVIHAFYSVDPHDPYYYIHGILDDLEEDLPATLLPIAEDPGGNMIVFSVAGDTLGQIFFWDHEEPDADKALVWCAPDLPTFLAILEPDDSEP